MSENRFIAALVPPSMRADLERSAAANERTLSGEIRLALKQHLASPRVPSGPLVHTAGGVGIASPAAAPPEEQT